MTDLQATREISDSDLERLANVLTELKESQIECEEYFRGNGHPYLYMAFKKTNFTDALHLELIESGWSAHILETVATTTRVELSPLITFEFNKECFHATQQRYLPSIKRNGLQIGRLAGRCTNKKYNSARFFIHVETRLSRAIDWATNEELLALEEPIFLSVKPRPDEFQTFLDPHSSGGLLINKDAIDFDETCHLLSDRDVKKILWKEIADSIASRSLHPIDVIDQINCKLDEFNLPLITRQAASLSAKKLTFFELWKLRMSNGKDEVDIAGNEPIVVYRSNEKQDWLLLSGRSRVENRISKKLSNKPGLLALTIES